MWPQWMSQTLHIAWRSLQLSSDLALLVGLVSALFAIGTILLRRWPIWFAAWRVLRVKWPLSNLPKLQRDVQGLIRAFIFVVGIFVGWGAKSIQQYERLDHFQMKILEHVSDREYVVRNLPPHESIPDEPYHFTICMSRLDPGWRIGSVQDVTFEDESSCRNFGDPFKTGWKEVKLEEVSEK